MDLLINGQKKELTETELTITELLKVENVSLPEMVSVQLNGSFIDREEFPNIKVKEKDEVDFLYFMGGGE